MSSRGISRRISYGYKLKSGILRYAQNDNLIMIARNDPFTCGHCHKKVAPIKYGGSYRNHCPFCLWSKHVDTDEPGDRKSTCKGMMEPIGVFTKRTGEYVLVHKCVTCGFERYNRIAGDDDFEEVTKLASQGTLLRS